MTYREFSEKRRAENELVFKTYNEQLEEAATKVLAPNNEDNFPLGFVCECADENCRERIQIPISEFMEIRDNTRQFIIKKGHAQGDIERVVRQTEHYQIVEKFEEPPAPSGTLNKTS